MKPRKVVNVVLVAGGLTCTAYSIVMGAANRFGLEHAALIAIGVASAVCGAFGRKILPYTARGVGRVLKFIFYGGVAIFVLSFGVSLIVMSAAANTKTNINADAIVVLGCGLKGQTITPTLRARLDKAFEYSMENPDAVIVVTGGKGPGEDITEAFAMHRYLSDKGISENRILMEDASTNTKENMLLSKPVLDSYFNGSAYSSVVVTSDFHMLRSLEYARIMELDADGISSKTPFYLVPAYYIREYLALIKLYIFRM